MNINQKSKNILFKLKRSITDIFSPQENTCSAGRWFDLLVQEAQVAAGNWTIHVIVLVPLIQI